MKKRKRISRLPVRPVDAPGLRGISARLMTRYDRAGFMIQKNKKRIRRARALLKALSKLL